MHNVNITINESDLKTHISTEISKVVSEKVDKLLNSIDINDLIIKVINSKIDRSQYVSDNIIRNFVQQKIAKELANSVLKNL